MFSCADFRWLQLKFVEQFKYLGHLISNSLSDDLDINREIKALFTNLLCRRFKHCSTTVKVKPFHSHCICLYDVALWSNFSVCAMNSLASRYARCMKSFFGYSKYSSITDMILKVGLPSFNTLMQNGTVFQIIKK